MLCLDQHMQA